MITHTAALVFETRSVEVERVPKNLSSCCSKLASLCTKAEIGQGLEAHSHIML